MATVAVGVGVEVGMGMMAVVKMAKVVGMAEVARAVAMTGPVMGRNAAE